LVRNGLALLPGLLAAAVCLLCFSPLPAGAAAASSPQPDPITIASRAGSIGDPTVAIDESGAATVAWVAGQRLKVASRAKPTGRWHVSRRFFSAGVRPQLAMDSAGDTLLAWERWEGSALVLKSAFRPAGGSWRPPTSLSGDLGEGQQRWHLDMNRRGDAVIIWSQHRYQGFPPLDAYYVMAATMSAGSGTWGPPSELSGAAFATLPALALDGSGQAIVAWRAFDQSMQALSVEASFGSVGPGGTAWSAPSAVSGAGEWAAEEQPGVAIGAGGGALVAWSEMGGSCGQGLPSSLVTASVVPGGSWSAPTEISRPGECPVRAQLAIDRAGRVTALWEAADSVATNLLAASGRLSGNEWSRPVHLETVGALPATFKNCTDVCPRPPAGLARLMVTGADGALAVWRQEGVGVAGSMETGAEWSAPTTLSSSTGSLETSLRSLEVAYRPQGEALLAWVEGRELKVDSLHFPPSSENP
jgi:hypothetical protein